MNLFRNNKNRDSQELPKGRFRSEVVNPVAGERIYGFMKKVLCLLFLIFVVSSVSSAVDLDDNDAGSFMDRSNAARINIRELERRNIAQTEANRIMRDFDTWSRTDLPSILEKHINEVASILQNVTLDGDIGRLDVYWSQLKAGVFLDTALSEIAEMFVRRAERAIQGSAITFQEQISNDLDEKLQRYLIEANENIWRRYELSLTQHYGRELISTVTTSPSMGSSLEKIRERTAGETDASHSPVPLMVGISMIMLPLIKKIVAKVSVAVAAKMGGKVLAKLIPGVGLLILAWEGFTIYGAKTNFEEELRKFFLTEYEQSFSVEAIWREESEPGELSLEKTIQQVVEIFCQEIEEECKNISLRVIDASNIIQKSSYVQEYLKGELEGGYSEIRIYDSVIEMHSFFKELMTDYDTKTLEQIYIRIPLDSRSQFSRLFDVIGRELIELFIRDRTAFDMCIQKAQLIGVDNYLRHRIEADSLENDLFRTAFTPYSSFIATDAEACDGVFLLLKNQLPARGLQQDDLRRVAKYQDVLLTLLPSTEQDRVKIMRIFQSERMSAALFSAYEKNPGLTGVLFRLQPFAFWDTSDARRIESILSVGAYLETEEKYSPEGSIEAVMNDPRLEEIFDKDGKDGLIIWHRFVGKDSGTQQEKHAQAAIELILHKGYPMDKLMTVSDVRWAEILDYLPVGGVSIFENTYHLSRGLRLVILWIPLLLFLYIIVFFFLKIWKLYRKNRDTTRLSGSEVKGASLPVNDEVIDAEISRDDRKQLEVSNDNSGENGNSDTDH